jgi:peptidoglycan/LPS O-acetylase OafA/YrhL
MKPDHHDNSRAVRIALASGVILHHARALSNGDTLNFPWVACFLVLSGYLILKSRESSASTLHFLWKRVLRIWPAMSLGFALVFVLLGREYLNAHFAATFFRPHPGGFWTITLEECLYLLLASAYALGLYRYAVAPWIGLAVSVGAFLLMPQSYGPEWRYLAQLPPMFFIGNIVYRNRERIPWNGWIALASLALIALPYSLLLGPYPRVYNLLTNALLAYPVIWVALYAKPVLGNVGKIGDPSYSMFLFQWPILSALAPRMSTWTTEFFLWGWVLSLGAGLLSWHLVEKRFLRLKDVWLTHDDHDRPSSVLRRVRHSDFRIINLGRRRSSVVGANHGYSDAEPAPNVGRRPSATPEVR